MYLQFTVNFPQQFVWYQVFGFLTCLLYQISSLRNDYSVSSCHSNAYKSIIVSSYVCESFPQVMQITFQLKGPTGSRIQEKKIKRSRQLWVDVNELT